MASGPSDLVRVGLLKCGSIRSDLVPEHGDYPELFADLFIDAGITVVTYDAEHGELPDSVHECDSWLVSGSVSSAYEPLEWIDRAREFVAAAVAADLPLVAICFGHQLLAQALGGDVSLSERGWGVGLHHYDVVAELPRWPEDLDTPTSLSLLASHQDQVTRLPEAATVLASSHHCPVAAFSVGDRVVAVQAHPEFTPELTARLIEARRDVIGEERSDAALAGLSAAADREVTAAWLAGVLVV